MNTTLQNLIALAVVAVAGLWLARSLWQRLWAPPCAGLHQDAPAGSDGFVSVDALTRK
jgi:hypothetical protein